jgi:hypothetical protein
MKKVDSFRCRHDYMCHLERLHARGGLARTRVVACSVVRLLAVPHSQNLLPPAVARQA